MTPSAAQLLAQFILLIQEISRHFTVGIPAFTGLHLTRGSFGLKNDFSTQEGLCAFFSLRLMSSHQKGELVLWRPYTEFTLIWHSDQSQAMLVAVKR